jgi:hypothetical protein
VARPRIPDIPGDRNIPPGAVDLSGLTLQGPQPTLHKTEFQSCQLGITPYRDSEGKVEGYELIIIDAFERHEYHFKFGPEMKDELMRALNDLPPLGEVQEGPVLQ